MTPTAPQPTNRQPQPTSPAGQNGLSIPANQFAILKTPQKRTFRRFPLGSRASSVKNAL